MTNDVTIEGPIAVDVLGTAWQLEITPASDMPTGPHNGQSLAFMNATTASLLISAEAPPSWRLYLLLHELLHALVFLGHLQFLKQDDGSMIDDEAKVDAVASLMTAFLKGNAKLVTDYMQAGA